MRARQNHRAEMIPLEESDWPPQVTMARRTPLDRLSEPELGTVINESPWAGLLNCVSFLSPSLFAPTFKLKTD